MLEKLLSDYRATLANVRAEQKEREEVEALPAFALLQAEIDLLKTKQEALLDSIPDSSEEHTMDKAELIKYLNDNNITILDGFSVKLRTSKSVNTNKVLHALDGDLDQFFLIANITQKALTEYGKLHSELKKPFKACIEIDSTSVTDLLLTAQ